MSQRFVRAIVEDQREELRKCGFAFTEDDVRSPHSNLT